MKFLQAIAGSAVMALAGLVSLLVSERANEEYAIMSLKSKRPLVH